MLFSSRGRVAGIRPPEEGDWVKTFDDEFDKPIDETKWNLTTPNFFWDGAANTLFWVDPKNKLTAVLFTQYKPFGKVPLHKDFRSAVYIGVDPSALPPK